MLHFTKDLITNTTNANTYGKWWGEVIQERKLADAEEKRITLGNSAAILPKDAWIEMDRVTTRIMRGDGGSTFMNDLMPLAKAVNVGKMVAMSRKGSDAGAVVRSISGQVATPTDKTQYKYAGAPIPIFSTGYHRSFREWEVLQYEGFDALFDDQENTLFNLRRDVAKYIMDGDTTISVENYKGYGIRSHPGSKSINLGSAAGGANIDLTTATPDAVLSFFDNAIMSAFDANFLTEGDLVNFYVSPAIMRNFRRNLSSAEGFKAGTLLEAIRQKGRIGEIKQTFELTGNAFFAFVPHERFIRPVIGQAVSTVALPRMSPRAEYVFDTWTAVGLEIRTDWNDRGGVFYSVVTN